jgi:hypothetical protein
MQRVRLNQHALELNRVQQLPQRLGFAAGIGGVGGLGNREAQALGIEADLGNECRCARVGFSDGAPQRLAVTDQRLESLRHTRLSRHPLAKQGFKASHVALRKQQSEGGSRGFLAEIGAQQLVEDLTVTSGKPLDTDQCQATSAFGPLATRKLVHLTVCCRGPYGGPWIGVSSVVVVSLSLGPESAPPDRGFPSGLLFGRRWP